MLCCNVDFYIVGVYGDTAATPNYKYVPIICISLIFRKTINAVTVMFAVIQLIRGAINTTPYTP